MTIEVYKRSKDVNLEIVSLDDELKPGDVCWLETPLNPTGEARYARLFISFLRETNDLFAFRDIKYYADKVSDVICDDKRFPTSCLRYTRLEASSSSTRPLLPRHCNTRSSGEQMSFCTVVGEIQCVKYSRSFTRIRYEIFRWSFGPVVRGPGREDTTRMGRGKASPHSLFA